ncbi:MAG: hypothetical protein HY000_18555, partial [Planctomycetes bacterium]|nr:hypothetical protein [Planctomycetota bacterium]
MATVQELRPAPEAVAVFTRLCRRPHCLFLDSARRDAALGRYSFVAADPFSYWERGVGERDALGELAARLSQFSVESL